VPEILALDESTELLLYQWFRRGEDPARPPIGRKAEPEVGAADCLAVFVSLKDARDVLAFARRWGPLELCEHGLPRFHSWPNAPFTVSTLGCQELPWSSRVEGQNVFYEPVSCWLSLARRTAAFLRLGEAVRYGRPRRAEDWQVFLNDQPRSGDAVLINRSEPDDWPGKDLTADRMKLMHELTSWMLIAGGGYLPTWEAGSRPTFRLSSGLCAVLCEQMLKAVAAGELAVACDGCGAVFRPTRRPAWNRNAYCPDCRYQVGNADRQRRLRERRRSQVTS
jgi:hypothetical protein